MTLGAIRYVVFIWCTSFLILPLLFFDVWQNSQFVKRLTAVRIIYSPHIHRAFHFAQLSLRTAYEFSVLRGWRRGSRNTRVHPLLLWVTQPQLIREEAVQGLSTTPHIAPLSNCSPHLGPFSVQPFPKAILLVWTPFKGCLSKDQTVTSSKDHAFNAQRRQLERQEHRQPSAPRCQRHYLADLQWIRMQTQKLQV